MLCDPAPTPAPQDRQGTAARQREARRKPVRKAGKRIALGEAAAGQEPPAKENPRG